MEEFQGFSSDAADCLKQISIRKTVKEKMLKESKHSLYFIYGMDERFSSS